MTDEEALRRIAVHVARLRGQRSKSWLARECGAYPSQIQRIEAREHMPGVGLLTRIAKSLDVTIDDLVSPTSRKSRRSA